MKKVITFFVFSVFFSAPLFGEELKSTVSDQKSVAVTVYNTNLGLVKDVRSVKLPGGKQNLKFMDVASQIKPPTVHIKSLTSPDRLIVLEQNYEYDLLNPQKIMDKYVGKKVRLVRINHYTGQKEVLEAELLSANSGTIYKIADEIHVNPPISNVIYPGIPGNLIAKPTLIWLLENENAGEQTVEVSYLTNGMNWKADYTAVLSDDSAKCDLSGWVTIDNQSGATYQEAKIKLVAGDIHQVREEHAAFPRSKLSKIYADDKRGHFEEEAFFEYHLYTLDRPSTIKENQTKQIELISVPDIPVRERLIYYGASHYYRSQMSGEMLSNQKIGVYIEIENKKENHLGMPLPKGTIRAYKKDKEGALQFVGEDQIDHTPKDEKFKINMGNAFDVVAERKQTDYRILSKHAMQRFDVEQEWEVTVRNHKETAVQVEVIEPLYSDWEMLNTTHPFEKIEAHTIKFVLSLKPDQSDTIKYRVKIRWW